jgi:hypothetical protein
MRFEKDFKYFFLLLTRYYLLLFVQSAEMCSMAHLQEFGGGRHRNVSSFMISSAESEHWKVGKSASF